ncbi:MAG: TonB-dependent receptor, partial [Bacteroidales bacterium]|nr:TonB-dependent receptor [Bacteroidales bacterium]
FRGTAESHTQVSWNGININSPMAGMVDFSLIPVYIIDDMSLKYGNASITESSGGLGGSVQISNNPDWNNKPGVKFMQGIGSYHTYDEFLQFGLGNKKFQSKTRVYYTRSENDYPFVNMGIAQIDPETGTITHPLDTNKNAAFSRYGFLQEFYFKPANNSIFSVRWWWQNAHRAIPQATSYEGPKNSNLSTQADVDNKIVADWKFYKDNYRLMLRSGYSAKKLDYFVKNNVSGIGEIPAVYSESTQKSMLNKASIIFDINDGLSIETSIDYNYHDVVSRDSVNKTGYQQDRSELSYVFSLRKSYEDRLNINLLLRQDWLDFKRAPIVPYLGFDYKVLRNGAFYLKGNIARNYHQPTLNDLYWQPGGNPALQPEDGVSVELGADYHFGITNILVKSEITAFYADINNWIIWIPGFKGYWEPQNIKNVVSKGVELNISVNGTAGKFQYILSGNYALTNTVNYGDPLVWGDESQGKQLIYIPLHSGNFMANLSFKKFHITWQHNSYSERFTTSGNDITQRNRFYPYFMNDLIAGKDFVFNKITISAELKIYNLFDETYHSMLYRPMPGRNYLLMLMIKY